MTFEMTSFPTVGEFVANLDKTLAADKLTLSIMRWSKESPVLKYLINQIDEFKSMEKVFSEVTVPE